MIFRNDGDPGYYVMDAGKSTNIRSDDVFRTPVGIDGQPRWASCTAPPCPEIPVPQSPPGRKGVKAIRTLSGAEVKHLRQQLAAAEGDTKHEDSAADDSSASSNELAALRQAMSRTSRALTTASPEQVAEAFRPIRRALPPVRSSLPQDPLVKQAATALELQESLVSFRRSRLAGTSTLAGMQTVSCQLMKNGVESFNRIAGTQAVTYFERKAPLSLLGLDSCLSDEQSEQAMLTHLRRAMQEAIDAAPQ